MALEAPDRAPPPPDGEPSDFVEHSAEDNFLRAREKKPAWSKPSNGAIEICPVMGAVSWPALSESTRSSPKPPILASDPLVTPPSPQGLQATSSPKKTSLSSLNSSVSKSHHAPARQRSMKRGGDSVNVSTDGTPENGAPDPASEERTTAVPSPKEHVGKNGDRGLRATGNENHRSFGSGGRRANNGGNGHHNNNSNVNRRENDWNQWSMNSWDGHFQYPTQPRGPRPYPRSLVPVTTQLYMPPPLSPIQGQPFPTHMVFTDVHSPLYYPAQEALSPVFVARVPPLYFLSLDPLRAAILKQIDYYFSSENLCKDIFLRQNMDDQGWVHISLIAGFNRVKLLTSNIQYILETVRYSAIVEVQGDKIRRRNDWMNWLLPSAQFAPSLAPESPNPTRSQDSQAPSLSYGSRRWP